MLTNVLTRQFKYIWTVNWRMLDEETFLNRKFHAVLLALHLLVLFSFVFLRWTKPEGGQRNQSHPLCVRDHNVMNGAVWGSVP